jgi:hypothetical protein
MAKKTSPPDPATKSLSGITFFDTHITDPAGSPPVPFPVNSNTLPVKGVTDASTTAMKYQTQQPPVDLAIQATNPPTWSFTLTNKDYPAVKGIYNLTLWIQAGVGTKWRPLAFVVKRS